MRKLIVLLSCVFLIYLSSCHRISSASKNLQELPPESGGCIITSKRFAEGWKWTGEEIAVRKSNPAVENHYLSMEIMLNMSGKHRPDDLELEIFNSLEIFTQSIDWKEELDFPPNDPNTVAINPKLTSIGSDMKFACVKEVADREYLSFGCQVKAIYDKHILIVFIRGPASTSESEIARILNPVFSAVDSCIVKLEQ